MHFYTSININYLPKARVLAKSVRKYCKDAKFSLVLSDKWPESINADEEPFDEIVTIEQLGIPVDNLNFWIYEHTVVELCTAVKGQALVKFLKEGSNKVVYLDPDIAVFNDLHELEQMLDEYPVVLTPHVTIPEDTRQSVIDNELCALKHGAYNFGFYAVTNNDEGLRFAEWWRDRLVEFCYDDIPNGIFTDQKWGDLVPCMFENVKICQDPGYNVSTWNISQRFVDKGENGIYTVNGVPLKFYHFSGFDSGAQIEMLDIYSHGNKTLYELRQWYINEQNEAQQDIYSSYPSVYNFYDDGSVITKEERILLRNRMDVIDYFKDTNPYVVEQERSYKKWYIADMNEKKEANPDINEILEKVYNLENELETLKEKNLEYENTLYDIYRSKGWKALKKIRGNALFKLVRRK